MMEVLSPAGNRESLEAAVNSGADAVYLGYAAFSARAGAGNFDKEQLKEAIRYAHLHHVKVYVTVNTLVKEHELADVAEVLRLLSCLGADGVLVQDLGVLSLARECLPELPVHASTQMALHNASGARWAKSKGMTRVVLARECPAKEIALASAEGVEIEVFGHGAQCVSVSGQCLFSSMLGERSGNRGRCAQPCRLNYTYRGESGAWLSPRDVCLRDDLDRLEKTGAVSLKIEGRLKRPEYVATVTGSYRKAVDAIENGTFRAADESEMRGLRQIFSRGGFMRGYAFGAQDAGVIDPVRVNHGGVRIGQVERVRGGFCDAKLSLDLHDGDQLQIRTKNGDAELIYSGKETPAFATAMIRLREGIRVSAGDEIYRLCDAQQLKNAMLMRAPLIPVDMMLTAQVGEAASLTATDGETFVTVVGETVQAAQKAALTEESARRSLEKTGDTPFTLRELQVYGEGAFMPASALNSLRREALEKLTEERSRAFDPKESGYFPQKPVRLPMGRARELVVIQSLEQLPLAKELGGEDVRIAIHPDDFRAQALEKTLTDMPEGTWLQMPTTCEEATLQMIAALVEKHQDRIGGVVLGSVGQLGIKWPVPFGAGSGVPVMNTRAAAFLFAEGGSFVTASPELTGREREALEKTGAPILVPAFGSPCVMTLHHCPERTFRGLDKNREQCAMCDKGSGIRGQCLTDRYGENYPLVRTRLPEGCIVQLLFSKATRIQTDMPRLIRLWNEKTMADVERQNEFTAHEKKAVE